MITNVILIIFGSVTSLSLLVFTNLFPIKLTEDIFVFSPLSISIIKSTLASLIFFTFASTLLKLNPADE